MLDLSSTCIQLVVIAFSIHRRRVLNCRHCIIAQPCLSIDVATLALCRYAIEQLERAVQLGLHVPQAAREVGEAQLHVLEEALTTFGSTSGRLQHVQL